MKDEKYINIYKDILKLIDSDNFDESYKIKVKKLEVEEILEETDNYFDFKNKNNIDIQKFNELSVKKRKNKADNIYVKDINT